MPPQGALDCSTNDSIHVVFAAGANAGPYFRPSGAAFRTKNKKAAKNNKEEKNKKRRWKKTMWGGRTAE